MNFKQRITGIGTAIICAASIFAVGVQPLIANAENYGNEAAYGDYLFYQKVDENEDGTYDYIRISGCKKSAVNIEIPAEIDGLAVKNIGLRAFYKCSDLESLSIPDTVTSIGKCAFSGCSSLISLSIPNGVTAIESEAFYGCSSLAGVTIPESVTSIAERAFSACSGITSVTIPDSVTYVGGWAFAGTEMLDSQTGVKYVDKWVVDCDDDVVSAEIKGGTKGITGGAFYNKEKLTDVIIPDSVAYLEKESFELCKSLENINVSENNPYYSSADGVLFNKNKTRLIAFPAGKSAEYTIPDSVISIEEKAFFGCDNLTGITIGNGVKCINEYTFHGCDSLISVTIGNRVTSICEQAFSYCYSLTSVTMPQGVKFIGKEAFRDCTDLESVIIPDSVTFIGMDAFLWCKKLKNVTLPDSLASIGIDAFKRTPFLDDQTGVKYSGAVVIGCDDDVVSAEIEDGTKTIADRAFSNGYFSESKSLESVTVPASVTYIGEQAFYCCSDLSGITILNPDCKIYDDDDTICSGYEGGCFYNGVIRGYEGSTAQAYAEKYGYSFESIGDKPIVVTTAPTTTALPTTTTTPTTTTLPATTATTVYTMVVIPIEIPIQTIFITTGPTYEDLSYIKIDENDDGTDDYISIKDCDESAVSVDIPDEIDGLAVKEIGDYALAFCKSLKSVTIPDSVTSIGYNAFRCSSDLESINVSENNTSYSSSEGVLFNKDKTKILEFPEGKAAKEYIIPDGVTSIGKEAFFGCSHLYSVVIPKSLTSIDDYAFKDCYGLKSVTIPDSVTSIGYEAFYGCSRLASVTIPESVTSIGYCAFEKCTNLADVTILNPDCKVYGIDTICNGFDFYDGTYYDGVIRGYSGSTAQDFAEICGYRFERLDKEPSVTTAPTVGDLPIIETMVTTRNPHRIPTGISSFSFKTETTTTTLPTTTTTLITSIYFPTSIYTTENTSTTTALPTTTTTLPTTITTLPITTKPVTTTAPETQRGDISGNGKIDLQDIIQIAEFMIGKRTFTDEEMKIADYNNDGKVGLQDVICVAKLIIKNNKK